MDVRLLALLFLLVSCLPTATVSRNGISDGSSSTTSGSGSGSDEETTVTEIGWNYLGVNALSINIDVSNLNTAYLTGTDVQDYLTTSSNFDSVNYCVVSTFTINSVVYELRARAVPISYYDFTKQKTMRVFRVDFPESTTSSSLCSGTLYIQNSEGSYIADTDGALSPVYDPEDICPTCSTSLSSTRVRVFKKGTSLKEIPSTSLKFSSLNLKVNPYNTSTTNPTSCSASSCAASGYDCCLDNQCVNDGTTRPSAQSTYPDVYATAEAERLQNPLAYLSYPQIYYICGTTPSTTSGSTTGSTDGGSTGTTTSGSSGGYEDGFEQIKKDYYCLQNLQSQATQTTYHQELLTRTDWTASTDCLTDSGSVDETQYYLKVVERLYNNCECSVSGTELADKINGCPAYKYVISEGTEEDPLQFQCDPPVSDGTITLPTQMTVSVSGRATPHRFFATDGAEYTLPQTSSSIVQEGNSFSYSDGDNLFPVQSNFSMNAILGQMSIALDKAQPAKTIDVGLDEVYFISATSGTYTPCPSCGNDSWFDPFKPHPSSSTGTGLQSYGFTTSRDSYDNNATGGNYEDTIFGRACWIPPTMIPYTHRAMSPTASQRQARLNTQSALFVNGYQRDWFGFNKGALIGSFDGVSWFAIGKGRIVKSSSTKLFLAINAPFADVATNSSLSVNIQAYDGTTQAAQVDYDPRYHQNHALQNEAGTCQQHHMCSTDTDCITRLGWEYACADVQSTKTSWPGFDSSANETAASNIGPVAIVDILAQKSYPTGTSGSTSTKRCVYRGAGSLCIRNPSTITDLNKKKAVTCGPNFYCASLNSSVFNGTVARYAAPLTDLPVSRNHLFGKDANVLGRPLNYLSGTSSVSLTSEIISSLTANMALSLPGQESLATSTNTGLCVPGKALPTSLADQATMANPFNQHLSADASKRADYINQIGSCNSVLFTTYRHSSCPVLGIDGNYLQFASTTIASTLTYAQAASKQNSCGLETLLNTASLSGTADTIASNYSPFRTIEAKVLPNQIVTEPTLVRDACLRRAGSVCHTDLDCSPNKFHSEQEDIYSLLHFGNQAEKDYYDQYLVCGQTDAEPSATDSNFKTYDMSKNRCCREVGSDITTYTPDTPNSVSGTSYDTTTRNLNMSLTPGVDPKNVLRYSRFATVENLGSTTDRPLLSAYQDRDASGDITTSTYSVNVMTPKQWKTLNEANSETCCGGGWIRKFANGSTWEDRNRLIFDVSNFSCINSRTALITNPQDFDQYYDIDGDGSPENAAVYDLDNDGLPDNPSTLVNNDYGDYCKDGTNTKGSCAQYSIPNSSADTEPVSDPYDSSVVINTLSPDFSGTNLDNFFAPRSADTDSATFVDYSNSSGRRTVAIRMPSFVPTLYDYAPASLPIIGVISTGSTLACTYSATLPASCGGTCCYSYEVSGTSRIVRANFNNASYTTEKVGIQITVPAAGSTTTPTVARQRPSSSYYYLKRLGRLELSGIPQITYEPLYCSDNADRLVPGIFSVDLEKRDDFETSAKAFRSGTKFYANNLALQTDAVFSPNEFKCCAPLGTTVKDSARCCSGYTTGTSSMTCSLPPGTDLMVYFNRYVSNEGVGSEKPGGGLVESDFDDITGEPLLTTTINGKIGELGKAYCSSGKIRQGGAFGSFEPQPAGSDTNLSSRIYGIVDSSNDNGTTTSAGTSIAVGYTQFTEFGFRWNHHLYCDD